MLALPLVLVVVPPNVNARLLVPLPLVRLLPLRPQMGGAGGAAAPAASGSKGGGSGASIGSSSGSKLLAEAEAEANATTGGMSGLLTARSRRRPRGGDGDGSCELPNGSEFLTACACISAASE